MTAFSKRFAVVLASGLAFMALGLGAARADEPGYVTEIGLPNSGIKQIKHFYSRNGFRPPLSKVWESSRETVYDDGRIVADVFNRDGTVSERTTSTPKTNHWIKEVYRPVLHQRLWTRTHNAVLNQTITEYYGLDGRLKLTRVMHKNGSMDVRFTDANKSSYVQHWLPGTQRYVLSSVDVTPFQSMAHTKYILLGKDVTRVEHYAPDGTVDQVLHLQGSLGLVDKVEHFSQGKLLNSAPGLGLRVKLPYWTFGEIGGLDDPSVPK